jgi:hypothetical protein
MANRPFLTPLSLFDMGPLLGTKINWSHGSSLFKTLVCAFANPTSLVSDGKLHMEL